jgi:hypothetical protein
MQDSKYTIHILFGVGIALIGTYTALKILNNK